MHSRKMEINQANFHGQAQKLQSLAALMFVPIFDLVWVSSCFFEWSYPHLNSRHAYAT